MQPRRSAVGESVCPPGPRQEPLPAGEGDPHTFGSARAVGLCPTFPGGGPSRRTRRGVGSGRPRRTQSRAIPTSRQRSWRGKRLNRSVLPETRVSSRMARMKSGRPVPKAAGSIHSTALGAGPDPKGTPRTMMSTAGWRIRRTSWNSGSFVRSSVMGSRAPRAGDGLQRGKMGDGPALSAGLVEEGAYDRGELARVLVHEPVACPSHLYHPG